MKKFLLSFLCCLLAVVSGYAEEVTYTVTSASAVSVSDGVAPTDSKATFKNTYTSNKVQLTKGNSMTLTLSGFAGNKITGISLSMKSNKSAGAGNFSATVGATEISSIATTAFSNANWAGKYSQDFLDVTPAMSVTDKVVEAGEDVVIKIAATANSLYCQSFTITYEYVPSGDTPEVAKPTIVGDTTFEESTLVNVNVADGTTAYYTLDDSNPTNESTEYTGTLTIKADATLKVIAYDENGNASSIVSQDFTQVINESAKTVTLVEDATNLKVGDQVVIVASDYNFALSADKGNNRGAVSITKTGTSIDLNNDVQIITLETGNLDNTFAFKTDEGYLYAASSSSNYLKTKASLDDNGSWRVNIDQSGSASIVAQGSYTHNIIRFNNGNSPKLFSCYVSGKQSSVSLYKVNYEPYTLNVSEAGWATLFLDYNAEIPADVTCYVISEFGAETIQLAEVTDAVPANTAVIVEAAKGAYTFEVADEFADVESVMTGTTKNEYVTEDAYVLSVVDDEVGLYKAEMNGGVFLNNANKAYLPASALPASVQGANGFKFRFETTGVEGVQVAQGKKVIFDLSGRKVNDMTAPGVYIVNGKKVLVK